MRVYTEEIYDEYLDYNYGNCGIVEINHDDGSTTEYPIVRIDKRPHNREKLLMVLMTIAESFHTRHTDYFYDEKDGDMSTRFETDYAWCINTVGDSGNKGCFYIGHLSATLRGHVLTNEEGQVACFNEAGAPFSHIEGELDSYDIDED